MIVVCILKSGANEVFVSPIHRPQLALAFMVTRISSVQQDQSEWVVRRDCKLTLPRGEWQFHNFVQCRILLDTAAAPVKVRIARNFVERLYTNADFKFWIPEYSSLATCRNSFSNCDSFKQYCGTSVTLSGGGLSGTTDTLCPITCGRCCS